MLITIIHYGCRKSSFYQALSRPLIAVCFFLLFLLINTVGHGFNKKIYYYIRCISI